MSDSYEYDEFCDFCQKETPHTMESAGHERDSSWDRIECKYCGSWGLGINGFKMNPPLENKDERS